MGQIVNTNIRMDLSYEDDRRAYAYLRGRDRKEFKSYSRLVVAALNDFFSRREKKANDPYLETREKEDRFLQQVRDTVKDEIRNSMGSIQVVIPGQPAQADVQSGDSSADEENDAIMEDFLKELGL